MTFVSMCIISVGVVGVIFSLFLIMKTNWLKPVFEYLGVFAILVIVVFVMSAIMLTYLTLISRKTKMSPFPPPT